MKKTYDRPEIFNSDQGSQFASQAFANLLENNIIKISIDGQMTLSGQCKNGTILVVVEENIYLNDYVSMAQMHREIQNYVNFYNSRRIHSVLN